MVARKAAANRIVATKFSKCSEIRASMESDLFFLLESYLLSSKVRTGVKSKKKTRRENKRLKKKRIDTFVPTPYFLKKMFRDISSFK